MLGLALAITTLLNGCANLNGSAQPSELPVRYRDRRYHFSFFLPASWKGHSVLVQQWDGQTYLPSADKLVVTEHGPIMVIRHPQWHADDRYQDIPILVFTRGQWEAHQQGLFSIGAGGIEEEIAHNSEYVFAISSRFNGDDSVKQSRETTDAVERNQEANTPHLHPM
jgi:hypothetical protein